VCTRCCREINEASQPKRRLQASTRPTSWTRTIRKVKWADVQRRPFLLVEMRLLALIRRSSDILKSRSKGANRRSS